MCTCGCYDCGSCNPELQTMVQCECCGKFVHRYDFCEQTGRCPDCEDDGMFRCAECDAWLNDDMGTCPVCGTVYTMKCLVCGGMVDAEDADGDGWKEYEGEYLCPDCLNKMKEFIAKP